MLYTHSHSHTPSIHSGPGTNTPTLAICPRPRIWSPQQQTSPATGWPAPPPSSPRQWRENRGVKRPHASLRLLVCGWMKRPNSGCHSVCPPPKPYMYVSLECRYWKHLSCGITLRHRWPEAERKGMPHLHLSDVPDPLGFSHRNTSRDYTECSEKQKISRERQFSGIYLVLYQLMVVLV